MKNAQVQTKTETNWFRTSSSHGNSRGGASPPGQQFSSQAAPVTSGVGTVMFSNPNQMPSVRRRTDLAKWNLVSIRLAVLCAEVGSLSRAAPLANMSLSRASHRLTVLEYYVGECLFKRHAQGMEPTRAGAILVEHGKALLATIDQLDDRFARLVSGE